MFSKDLIKTNVCETPSLRYQEAIVHRCSAKKRVFIFFTYFIKRLQTAASGFLDITKL